MDSDTARFIVARGLSQGAAVSSGVIKATDNLIKLMKSNGTWEASNSLLLLAGARSLNEALVPLKGLSPSSFNFVNSDLNFYTGLVGNGSTKYLNSNMVVPSNNQNNFHASVWRTQAEGTLTTESLIGNSSILGGLQLTTTPVARVYQINNTTGVVPDLSRNLGFLAVSRSSNSEYNYRYNGVTTPVSVASVLPTSDNITIFARNTVTHTSARLAIYGIGTGVDLALLESSFQSYMTAISAL